MDGHHGHVGGRASFCWGGSWDGWGLGLCELRWPWFVTFSCFLRLLLPFLVHSSSSRFSVCPQECFDGVVTPCVCLPRLSYALDSLLSIRSICSDFASPHFFIPRAHTGESIYISHSLTANSQGMVLCLKSAEALATMITGDAAEVKKLDEWFPRSFRVTKERLGTKFKGRRMT